MNYLDPKNDFILRKIFGRHPHLLTSFLNATLPLPEGSFIESLEYLPVELALKSLQFNYSIVEVRCNDNHGRQFIVELLMNWTPGFMFTLQFNNSTAYIKPLAKAIKIDILLPVNSLNLVYDSFLPEKPEYYHHYQTVKYKNTSQKIEGFELVFIELLKFKASNIAVKNLDVLWLRFLTEIDESTNEVSGDLLENIEIKEALGYLKTSTFSKAELATYEKYWDCIYVERTVISDSYDKGLAKGKLHKTYNDAINGFSKKMTIEELSELTELPLPTLEKLKQLFGKYGQDAANHFEEVL